MRLLYRMLTFLLHPLVMLHLRRRLRQGKEDKARWPERLALYSDPPPGGAPRIWVHAASVGESLSVLALLERLRQDRPGHDWLITTGTVTSAAMMRTRLPPGMTHRYAPVDTPQTVRRFLDHWKPSAALWVESELWPNLLWEARRRGIPLALVNGRLSARSARRWRRMPGTICAMLNAFSVLLAQSEGDAARFRSLGAHHARFLGNLKADAAPLPHDEAELARLRAALEGRVPWLAASTHPGEEEIVAEAHETLAGRFPALLTILAPRHPHRAEAIETLLAGRGLSVARRSRGEVPGTETSVYLADTLGELGVFYRLCPMAFLGGSLVPAGGHNPLEPALLNCALLLGPHTFNFFELMEHLTAEGAATVVHHAPDLASQLARWLHDPSLARRQADAAFAVASSHRGAVARVASALRAVLP